MHDGKTIEAALSSSLVDLLSAHHDDDLLKIIGALILTRQSRHPDCRYYVTNFDITSVEPTVVEVHVDGELLPAILTDEDRQILEKRIEVHTATLAIGNDEQSTR